jgi:hypothetical protein
MRKILLALAGVAILAATPAAADPCIRQNDIWNWSSINDKTLILENSRHQKIVAKLIGTCSDLAFRQTIAIKSFAGFGLSCIERGDTVITRSAGFRGSCSIASIEPFYGPMKRSYHDSDMHRSAHPSY